MNLSKVNLILVILLSVGSLFLFLNFVKLQENLAFSEKRIDALEKRPLISALQSSPLPEAGESGRVVTKPLPSSIPTPIATPTATPKSTATPAPQTRVTYLPVFGGNAQTTDTNWVDVSGSDFQLKSSDYGGSPYFSWDAIAFLIGGSGQARMRLYDTTNNVAVSGSEISITASKPTLVSSGKMSFFSGNNLYRVQISSLTSSTAEFDFGRVKVVY